MTRVGVCGLVLMLAAAMVWADTVRISREEGFLNFWDFDVLKTDPSRLDIVLVREDEDVTFSLGKASLQAAEDAFAYEDSANETQCRVAHMPKFYMGCRGQRFSDEDLEECAEDCGGKVYELLSILGLVECGEVCTPYNYKWYMICDVKYGKHCSVLTQKQYI